MRGSTALPFGAAVLEALKREEPGLIAAAEQKRPPVAAVSGILLERFGEEAKRTPVRQFVGLATRAVLEEAGYEVAYRGVRITRRSSFSVWRRLSTSRGRWQCGSGG